MSARLSFRFLLLPVLIIIFYGCKKAGSSDNPSPSYVPAVTPVGTPVGNPVSKTIGSGGGLLASSDGKIELTIPAGALSSNTNISIQPVTNEAPGGIGLSYHLMPDGTKFAKPVTLTYHYTDKDINGTTPYLLYIAYQDSLLQWKADFKKRNVDTIAKTVSLGISHFSIWSMGARLYITAFPDELRKDEMSVVSAVIQSPPEPSSGSDDELPPLPSTSLLNDVSNWKVNGQLNGNNQNGLITGTGNRVSYKAPSSITQKQTVQISAEVKYSISEFNNNQLVASVTKLILFKEITLMPDVFEFHLVIEYAKTTYLTTAITLVYKDKAEMDVSVKDKNVTVSNISNPPFSITPSSSTPLGECTYTLLPGPNGYLNVTGGGGSVGVVQGQQIFGVLLTEIDCHVPGYDLTCPREPTASVHLNPQLAPGPLIESFILKDSAQIKTYEPNGEIKTVYRLAPR